MAFSYQKIWNLCEWGKWAVCWRLPFEWQQCQLVREQQQPWKMPRTGLQSLHLQQENHKTSSLLGQCSIASKDCVCTPSREYSPVPQQLRSLTKLWILPCLKWNIILETSRGPFQTTFFPCQEDVIWYSSLCALTLWKTGNLTERIWNGDWN